MDSPRKSYPILRTGRCGEPVQALWRLAMDIDLLADWVHAMAGMNNSPITARAIVEHIVEKVSQEIGAELRKGLRNGL